MGLERDRLGTIRVWAGVLAVWTMGGGWALAQERPPLVSTEAQPLAAQARRVVEALDFLGQPLTGESRVKLDRALADPRRGGGNIQEALDAECLAWVEINPESRVKSARGPAKAELVQQGWRVFLVKVINEAGVTAPLRVESPNAAPIHRQSTSSPSPKPGLGPGEILDRWMEVRMFDDRPMTPALTGATVEYRLLQVYSRDAGDREGRLSFNAGQGTQDLGFRSDVDILFRCAPAVEVKLAVRDHDGTPTTASFLVKDSAGRVYPARSRRLAPDFFFHDQVYRADGETLVLPPGVYDVEWTRGPEYVVRNRKIEVPRAERHEETFELERWTNLAARGWRSGDHHVHAAGCGHYESPTEGVRPEDMMRHIVGEDLNVGCVLSWGPCWYFQKEFFEGTTHALSTAENLMRYDVEVSGFPSSHAGHLCLLRLREDDYPGATRIEEWPSWDLPVLKWGKSQGGVVGFSHSGWGLKVEGDTFPTEEVPPFDGIGANEYIVDVTHDAVDFISAVDTPAVWELNIWYHTLNVGYRARISGETDFPCIYGERVGLGRSYVKLDGNDPALDFDAWCEGLKAGRSYVSDGRAHLVDFRLNDVEMGVGDSELKLDKPGRVKVRADVAARLEPQPTPVTEAVRNRPLDEKPYWDIERARLGNSRRVPVEVVVNGEVVAREEIEADGEFRPFEAEIPIERSSWVALRIFPSAHTNPIWVAVADKPVRASRKSAEWCLKAVDVCWEQKAPRIRESELDEARAAYEHARAAYRRILEETEHD